MDTPDENLEKLAALGRMTRVLIHDFNNSLASIMGHADFLVADLPEGSEQHIFAQNIKQAAVQLQNSLNQIKSFSANESLKEEALALSTTPFKARSILLVEDREMVLNTISTMLQRDHHQVESVIDGFAALDMIRENPSKYDVLITDYNMPNISGKDLLEEIRQDFKNMPVIIMSGDAQFLDELKKDPKNKNIFVLAKPIIADHLKNIIQSL